MKHKILKSFTKGIAFLSFNCPDSYNAFDLDAISEFTDHLVSMAADSSVKGIIISGTGKAFSCGGDLKWVSNFSDGPSAAFHELSNRYHQAILEIRNMRKPVLAAINGIAAGGGFSLALACDFRIMSKTAALRQGYTSTGLSIDGGGTHSLPRLVGIAKSLEIIAFDEVVNANDALQLGLVTKIVADDELQSEAIKMMHRIFQSSLHSFGWSKYLLNTACNTSFETMLELERIGIKDCSIHPDGIEGMTAFLEKRKPEFNK